MVRERKLEGALRRVFNMMKEDAQATADVVETVFQGEEEVNDEDLDKEIRSLFYSLEKENLLQVRRTEYKLDGQVRRAYFWSLGDLGDLSMDDFGPVIAREELETHKVYQQLPEEMWNRRNT